MSSAANPFRRTPTDPATSIRDHGLAGLRAVVAGLGLPVEGNPFLEAFALMLPEWTKQPLGELPWRRSDLGMDGLPYEFSATFGPNGLNELRFVVEAQGDTPSPAGNQRAARELSRKLNERYGIPLERVTALEDLFFPDEAFGSFAAFHAVVWAPGKPLEFKVYFNPRCRGPHQAHAVLHEAMVRLGMTEAWRVTKDAGFWRESPPPATRYEGALAEWDEPFILSLDVPSSKDKQSAARIKLYWQHYRIIADELERRCALLVPSYVKGTSRAVLEGLLGHPGPIDNKPLNTYLSYVEGESRPTNVALQVPIVELFKNDRDITERLERYFESEKVSTQAYRQVLDALAFRPLDEGLGLHNIVGVRRDGDVTRVAVYFGMEGYPLASSRVPGMHKMPMDERLLQVGLFSGLMLQDAKTLRDGLPLEVAEQMSENVIGTFSLPLGVATNFRINKRDYLVPMVVEEPSVVAAASFAAKMLRAGTGIRTSATEALMIGQIHFPEPPPQPVLEDALEAHAAELGKILNDAHPGLCGAGGGFRGARVRRLHDAEGNAFAVVHLEIDVRDAMGANVVNSMAEEAAELLERWTGARAGLRILSNLPIHRRVRAEGEVRLAEATTEDKLSFEDARRIEEASRFAEADPYRAVTANKGIMNGIDAVMLATGQDFRAGEAAAHAWAAYKRPYGALATWRVQGEVLKGTLELPLALGTVGGITSVHPQVRVNLRLLGAPDAKTLSQVVVAVGLAQNFAATRALAVEGIQQGHMRLHARNIAVVVGATQAEAGPLVEALVASGRVSESHARLILTSLRNSTRK